LKTHFNIILPSTPGSPKCVQDNPNEMMRATRSTPRHTKIRTEADDGHFFEHLL
jgi:hypothetical protein